MAEAGGDGYMKQMALSDVKDDWFEYRLEHDSRFLHRIASARRSLREDRGVKFEHVDWS